MHAHEETIWATQNARVVRVHCAADDARLNATITGTTHSVSFPRAAVWLRRAGEPALVADPAIAVIDTPGTQYTRVTLSESGERYDRFELSPAFARRIASQLELRSTDGASVWARASWAPVDNALYVRQRVLFRQLEAQRMYDADAEREIATIVSMVLTNAMSVRAIDRQARAASTHSDLVEHAKSELNRQVTQRIALNDLARTLGVSPFHLCRIFKSRTGQTLHQYQLTVRLRMALEPLGESDVDLSRLAHSLGFANHSHFTNAMRRRFGVTPSALRQALQIRPVARAHGPDWWSAALSSFRAPERVIESA
jgi:AraC-like DNA-binding protein